MTETEQIRSGDLHSCANTSAATSIPLGWDKTYIPMSLMCIWLTIDMFWIARAQTAWESGSPRAASAFLSNTCGGGHPVPADYGDVAGGEQRARCIVARQINTRSISTYFWRKYRCKYRLGNHKYVRMLLVIGLSKTEAGFRKIDLLVVGGGRELGSLGLALPAATALGIGGR